MTQLTSEKLSPVPDGNKYYRTPQPDKYAENESTPSPQKEMFWSNPFQLGAQGTLQKRQQKECKSKGIMKASKDSGPVHIWAQTVAPAQGLHESALHKVPELKVNQHPIPNPGVISNWLPLTNEMFPPRQSHWRNKPLKGRPHGHY